MLNIKLVVVGKLKEKFHKEEVNEYLKRLSRYSKVNIIEVEEEKIKDASINYQMLQTLTDITDEEIDAIIKTSNDKLSNLCSSISSMK